MDGDDWMVALGVSVLVGIALVLMAVTIFVGFAG